MVTGKKKMSRPNVLFLFSDQHKASVLGCEGHPDVHTPNLDILASKGVRFARAYCQDAICAPSRNSLFSGLYPRTLGCLDNADQSSVMKQVVPLQKTFQSNGYTTAAFGKRHLDLACDEGWDIKASHIYHESPQDHYPDWVVKKGYGEAFSKDWAAEFGKTPPGIAESKEIPFEIMSVRNSELPENMTMEAFTAERTVDFIHAQKNQEKPFFCFSSFYRPHQPYTPLKSFVDRFQTDTWGNGTRFGESIRMPESLRQPYEELPPLLQSWFLGDNRVWRLDMARKDEQIYRNYIAAYYALVMEIDARIGSILQALDESGMRENTIIVYASDHGDFVGAHGMVEKCAQGHNVYEDTLRVPLIISWPAKLLKNFVCNDLTELADIYPTLISLCGCELPALKYPLQGLSLVDTLSKGKPTNRTFSVSENWSQATIITSKFKYGKWLETNRSGRDFRAFGDLLFDLQSDPGECNNLDQDHAFDAVKKDLQAKMDLWENEISNEGKYSVIKNSDWKF